MAETPPTVDEPVARGETPRARQRTPWRVEGARDAPEKGARGSQMPGGGAADKRLPVASGNPRS